MTTSGLTQTPLTHPAQRIRRALEQTRGLPFYQTEAWLRGLTVPTPVLSSLPRISKEDLRRNSPQAFVLPDMDLRGLEKQGLIEEESTSGTSGASIRVVFGRSWWAEQELRALRRNPHVRALIDRQPDAKRAVLTTPGCSGVSCFARWLSVEQRTLGPTLFANQARIPFSLSVEKLDQMTAEILAWGPAFLDVDPVHGAWFALHCERHGVRLPSLRLILTSYEYASVTHRRIMQRVFGVPVVNLYGSTETGHLLIEQDGGGMEPSEETAILEVADPDARGIGQLLVTTLTNPYLPLVRYEIGDHVSHQADCYQIHGRIRDSLRDATGAVVTTRMVDQMFEGAEGIAHYQLRQSAAGPAELVLLPSAPGDELGTTRKLLEDRLSGLLGHPVSSRSSPLITPEDSGKFRLTVRDA